MRSQSGILEAIEHNRQPRRLTMRGRGVVGSDSVRALIGSSSGQHSCLEFARTYESPDRAQSVNASTVNRPHRLQSKGTMLRGRIRRQCFRAPKECTPSHAHHHTSPHKDARSRFESQRQAFSKKSGTSNGPASMSGGPRWSSSSRPGCNTSMYSAMRLLSGCSYSSVCSNDSSNHTQWPSSVKFLPSPATISKFVASAGTSKIHCMRRRPCSPALCSAMKVRGGRTMVNRALSTSSPVFARRSASNEQKMGNASCWQPPSPSMGHPLEKT
mmetsp:Transcript_4809/g.18213  ORF Transcript_4809/g.18213 Transcript_4809/m.18213 type:complete len:271 (-) Transcript_4809:1785-2597(-)